MRIGVDGRLRNNEQRSELKDIHERLLCLLVAYLQSPQKRYIDVKDPEVGLEGFEIHRKDRNVNGGGVAIYVDSRISHNQRYDIDDPLLEMVAVEITPTHAKSYVVICWYRPPPREVTRTVLRH